MAILVNLKILIRLFDISSMDLESILANLEMH